MSYHTFWLDRKWDDREETAAVFYFFRNGQYAGNLSETIDRHLNRHLPPARLLIVAPLYAEKSIQKAWDELDELTLQRLTATPQAALVSYGCDGKLHTAKILRGDSGENWPPTDLDLVDISRAGVEQLIESTKAVLKAPDGYHFRKPSDHLNKAFIRAGNMFKDPAALALVQHLLLRVVPLGTKQLFIDSLTILPVALHFREECAKFKGECSNLCSACAAVVAEPTITNFHSYAIESTYRFPGHRDYFVLISATSSGSLRKQLAAVHGADLAHVFHLLALSPQRELEDCSLYFKYEEDDLSKISPQSLKQISIPSEEFVASHGEARAVKISKAHTSKLDRSALSETELQDVLELRLGASYRASSTLFGLSDGAADFTPKFKKWLSEQLKFSIPNNVSSIVSGYGVHSYEIGEHVASNLRQRLKLDIEHCSLTELLAGRKLKLHEGGSVLVVCAEESSSSGEQLVAASRALREYKDTHRHYLVGWAFPETRAAYERVKTNIRLSPWEDRKYGWSNYLTTPIGNVRIHSSWRIEGDLLTAETLAAVPIPNEKLRAALTQRAAALLEPQLAHKQLFLPKFDGGSLELQHDSIFLGDANLSHVAINLALAGALQRSREGQNASGAALAPDECFDNNPFIDTVLDPDMFSRFNDGVFQAAILRSSSADELNYSRNRAFSRHMKGIVQSALKNRYGSNGEAAMEFLFALATERLRLEKDDRTELDNFIAGDPELQAVWKLLKYKPFF